MRKRPKKHHKSIKNHEVWYYNSTEG